MMEKPQCIPTAFPYNPFETLTYNSLRHYAPLFYLVPHFSGGAGGLRGSTFVMGTSGLRAFLLGCRVQGLGVYDLKLWIEDSGLRVRTVRR